MSDTHKLKLVGWLKVERVVEIPTSILGLEPEELADMDPDDVKDDVITAFCDALEEFERRGDETGLPENLKRLDQADQDWKPSGPPNVVWKIQSEDAQEEEDFNADI